MVPEIAFVNLVIVAAIAFVLPLLLGYVPWLRLPSVVLEIAAGIAIGPAGLGWVRADLPVQLFALVGLAFILFLAGLEIEFARLRGRLLGLALGGFALSFGLALLATYALGAARQVESPLFVAIMLAATSLGVVIPTLKDAGQGASEFGQLVIVA